MLRPHCDNFKLATLPLWSFVTTDHNVKTATDPEWGERVQQPSDRGRYEQIYLQSFQPEPRLRLSGYAGDNGQVVLLVTPASESGTREHHTALYVPAWQRRRNRPHRASRASSQRRVIGPLDLCHRSDSAWRTFASSNGCVVCWRCSR